jgi:glycerol kinase
MKPHYILALDQGTTSSRSILFDKDGQVVASSQKEFSQIFPQAGWVEHDPMEIWDSQIYTAREVMKKAGIDATQISGIGITNQRETTLIWDKKTGRPVHNAIVWQDRRTAGICDEIKKKKDLAKYICDSTGLVIDAYFSATKIKWLLDNDKSLRKRAEDGELYFGTVDTWLVYNLTGGQLHITDYSNASRTLLYSISKPKNGTIKFWMHLKFRGCYCRKWLIPVNFTDSPTAMCFLKNKSLLLVLPEINKQHYSDKVVLQKALPKIRTAPVVLC